MYIRYRDDSQEVPSICRWLCNAMTSRNEPYSCHPIFLFWWQILENGLWTMIGSYSHKFVYMLFGP